MAGQNLTFRIGRMSHFKKPGGIISYKEKDLYKIKKYTPKKTNFFVKCINATTTKNISFVEMEDLQTGEKFILNIGKSNSIKTPEAILLRVSDNKDVIVKKGDKVPFDDKFSAEIANINVGNQTVTFVTGSKTNILKASQKKPEPPAPKTEEKVTLDFKNVPVVEVLNYLSDLKGDIVVYSHNITNKKITVTYHKPVTLEEAKTIIIKSLKLGPYSVSMERDKDGKQTLMVED